MENVSVLRKKGGQFCTQKVSVFIEIGVFFSLKIREKGSFFKSGNPDMSSFLSQVRGPGEYVLNTVGLGWIPGHVCNTAVPCRHSHPNIITILIIIIMLQ